MAKAAISDGMPALMKAQQCLTTVRRGLSLRLSPMMDEAFDHIFFRDDDDDDDDDE